MGRRHLRSASLTPPHLPTADEEAFRDLVQARASGEKRAFMVGYLRPEGMLAWLPAIARGSGRGIPLQPCDLRTVWAEWWAQLVELDTRIQCLGATIQLAMPEHPLYPLMLAFQTLRGVDWITAATLVAEGEDFSQFPRPSALMSGKSVWVRATLTVDRAPPIPPHMNDRPVINPYTVSIPALCTLLAAS